ncbi:MAG: pyridoxamine 5'-phosphate oxidase family protein [Mycoplasmatales bacterium]
MKLEELLKERTVVFVANIFDQDNVKVKAMDIQQVKDGKVYISTSVKGNMISELEANSNISFTQFNRGIYTRVAGKAKFLEGEEQSEVLEYMIQNNPGLVSMYTEDGIRSNCRVFTIDNMQVWAKDFKNQEEITID